MISVKDKKVLVTGAASMIGKAVVAKLEKRGAIVYELLHEDCDLLDFEQTLRVFKAFEPEYCIHAAGYNGNINFNKLYPSDIFYNTTVMGLNTLKACALVGVEKVVSTLASCAYRSTDDPLREQDFNLGLPDRSVEAHGLSKKALYYYSKQIYKQYGTLAVCTIFNTAYGPHDSFNVNKTKVVGGLIKKFTDAVENDDQKVVCWGTGRPRRELIYCDDAAEGILQTLEKYNDVEQPINIGFNKDISIKELAELISSIVGFRGDIVWDLDKPDGQYRKILDSTRMKEYNIEIKKSVAIEEGIVKTINWLKEYR
jgi:GDP-L-fucose synthase|tara:strand:+ start:258 stop:1193 length:936 start_codon:yes stop_codon:yes gene_type:complete